MIPGEPEISAKSIPSNFAWMKKHAHYCQKCHEPFITDLATQIYCPTCRGGEMGRDQARRFMENWNHGVMVGQILEDMRR